MVMFCSFVFVVLALDFAAAAECPNNWSAHDGSCYFFSREKNSWSGASVICSALEANLVEIDDDSEDNFIYQNVRGYQAWIGLTDIEEESHYMWMRSHSSMTYSHWAFGQPNHLSSGENCVVVNTKHSALGRGWNDKKCTDLHNYVCEKRTGESLIVG